MKNCEYSRLYHFSSDFPNPLCIKIITTQVFRVVLKTYTILLVRLPGQYGTEMCEFVLEWIFANPKRAKGIWHPKTKRR